MDLNQNLLAFIRVTLFSRAGYEDHVVDLAKGPNQVCDFLLGCIFWDVR